MSLETRTEISDAANVVEGVNVTPYFRQTTKAGQGWVRLDRWNRDTSGFAFMQTWAVVIVLPQDQEAAEKYLDEKLPDLVTATAEALIVSTVTPARLALDSGILPVVMIEGTRAT